MSSPDRQLRFGRYAFALFTIGAVAVVLLEIVEQQGIIGKLTEGVARFAVFLPLLIIFVALSRKPYFSVSIRCAALVSAAAAGTDMILSITEDIQSLENVPLIGLYSEARLSIETVLKGTWVCSVLCLFYLLFRSVEDAQRQTVQRERLSAMGEMANSLAHDLNNTLSPVVGYRDERRRAASLSRTVLLNQDQWWRSWPFRFFRHRP